MSVTALTDTSIDLFGKTVDELQENVSVGEDAITGTLLYVDDYDDFSDNPASQSGNYIAILCAADVNGATITAEVDNPVTLSSDGIAVLRITDKDTQTITVVASKEGYTTATKTYSLTGLTCESEI